MPNMAFRLPKLLHLCRSLNIQSKIYTAHNGVIILKAARTFSTPNYPVVRQTLPPQHDALMENLKSYQSTNSLLDFAANHTHNFEQKHIMQVLRSLFDLQRDEGTAIKTSDIISNPSFNNICNCLKKLSRGLEMQEVVDAIKILSWLKLSANTTVVQTLLQLVRADINNLNLRQIMFLDFILEKNESNHLLDALRLALPLAFQLKAMTEMDTDDLILLKDMLHFAARNNLPDRCFNSIVTALIVQDRDIDINCAKSIVWSLADKNISAERIPIRTQLLSTCLDIMAYNINVLSHQDVIRTLGRLKEHILNRHGEFYHEKFMDACAEYLIHNKVGFEKSLLVARILSRVAHNSLPLLDYLSGLVSSWKYDFTNSRPNILFSYVTCLSNANYTPLNWETIKESMLESRTLFSANVKMPWTKAVLELASLDCYDDRLLSMIFSKSFLEEYLARDKNTLDHSQLLMLQEAVKHFHRDYNGDYLPPDVQTNAEKIYYEVSHNMLSVSLRVKFDEGMARALNGAEYYIPRVKLPGGLIADYVVVFNDNLQPVSLRPASSVQQPVYSEDGVLNYEEPKIIPLEQLPVSDGHFIVSVLALHSGCFSINCDRIRGIYSLLGRTIAAAVRGGTLTLNVGSWVNMPEAEQTPYLARELQHAARQQQLQNSVAAQ